jgi:hypothetical protein
MSLFSELHALLGPGSVPVVSAGCVYGVFAAGEKMMSERARDALSQWLLSFEIRKVAALPGVAQELFNRVFGARHFSIKCFVRSVLFSVGATVILTLLVFLISPQRVVDNVATYRANFMEGGSGYYLWAAPFLWLPWNILIDYFSLLKTRVVLRILGRLVGSTLWIAPIVLLGDYLLYSALFMFGWAVNSAAHLVALGPGGSFFGQMADTLSNEYEWHRTVVDAPLFDAGDDGGLVIFSILFWAGFAPSAWLWLYVLSLFLTRAMLRTDALVSWLRWALDIEKRPFQSIGAVAAALVFVGSAIILVLSAAVSRIA